MQAINAPAVHDHFNGIRARLEAGDMEQADQFHRRSAWAIQQNEDFYECMADTFRLIAPNVNESCMKHLESTPPDDWEIPRLDEARTRFNTSSTETTPQ